MYNSNALSHNITNSNKPYVTKSGLFILIIVLIAVQNNVHLINYSFSCLYDLGIQLTNSIAKTLSEDATLRHTLEIISSLLIDLTVLSTMIMWIIQGKSWRFFVNGVCFYGMRAIIQFTFMMPFPEYYSFDYPGFPSLMVSYAKTNDFFYSGHVGIPIICANEYYKNKSYIIACICLFISVFQGFILLIHHAHYGLDIIIGMICAHYFCKVTDKYVHYIDNSCISIDENRYMNRNLDNRNYLLGSTKNDY